MSVPHVMETSFRKPIVRLQMITACRDAFGVEGRNGGVACMHNTETCHTVGWAGNSPFLTKYPRIIYFPFRTNPNLWSLESYATGVTNP